MGYEVVAPDIRSFLLPKQTVHPARNKRIIDTNVSQNPGPVIVLSLTPSSWLIWCLTHAKSAISMTNARRVKSAARNETMDAKSVTVTWVEKESRSAMKVTPVATG